MHKLKWNGSSIQERTKRAGYLRRERKRENPMAGRVAELMLTREIIDAKLTDQEQSLRTTAWLAYGFMSAYEKTELFCEEYVRLYKYTHAKYFDHAHAANMQPLDPSYAKNENREMSSLWTARQRADALGIPYSRFIRVSMDTAVQWNKAKQVPRPNQLTGDKQIKAIIEEWERWKSTERPFSADWDPRFFAPDHRAAPPRLMAVEALVERLRSRPHSIATNLANHLGEGKALTEAEARTFFDKEIVDEALSYGRPDPGLPSPPTADYLPPCIGMKPKIVPAGCSACRFAAHCDRVQAKVDALLIAKHGTATPKEAGKAASARERKRKQREKEKAAQMASS